MTGKTQPSAFRPRMALPQPAASSGWELIGTSHYFPPPASKYLLRNCRQDPSTVMDQQVGGCSLSVWPFAAGKSRAGLIRASVSIPSPASSPSSCRTVLCGPGTGWEGATGPFWVGMRVPHGGSLWGCRMWWCAAPAAAQPFACAAAL